MIYRFGAFSLDTDRVELRRDDTQVPLEPQVFSVLAYLIENRDHVVSRDELIDAVWHGRIISDAALSTRINGARRAVGDDGKTQAVLRTVPRRGFRFVADVDDATEDDAPPAASTADPALPDRPAIAVLPFTNLSGDPEQEYFSDGISEDIITALSHVRSFLVIARNSSFTYKGRSVDARTIGRELGVHYLLEGSVRRSGDQVRVSAQLVEAATAAHVWADRFDGAMDDIFDLQDRIAASVVGAIQPELLRAEAERIKQKRPDSLDAYDYTLRGLALMDRLTPEDTAAALALFREATERDPGFARAYVLASWCFRRDVQLNGLVLGDEDRRTCLDMAEKGLATDPTDPYVLWQGGLSIAMAGGELERGRRMIEQSLDINANSTRAWLARALVDNTQGRPEAAIEAAERGIRLSPLETAVWVAHCELSISWFQLADYARAADYARRSLDKHRFNLPAHHILAASLAHLGRTDEAEAWIERLRERDPNAGLARLHNIYPIADYRNLENLLDGLEAAGFPQH